MVVPLIVCLSGAVRVSRGAVADQKVDIEPPDEKDLKSKVRVNIEIAIGKCIDRDC